MLDRFRDALRSSATPRHIRPVRLSFIRRAVRRGLRRQPPARRVRVDECSAASGRVLHAVRAWGVDFASFRQHVQVCGALLELGTVARQFQAQSHDRQRRRGSGIVRRPAVRRLLEELEHVAAAAGDGQFTGTTDEIFQWAACKWGLPDDVLRAIAVRESTWYQYETYPSGRCVLHFSCGDIHPTPTRRLEHFCDHIATFGHDYQQDYSDGICPKTFGIVGVMSWQAPSWGLMADNQNGTFPFNRNSTAFAVDYVASYLRGCYEGWITGSTPPLVIFGVASAPGIRATGTRPRPTSTSRTSRRSSTTTRGSSPAGRSTSRVATRPTVARCPTSYNAARVRPVLRASRTAARSAVRRAGTSPGGGLLHR